MFFAMIFWYINSIFIDDHQQIETIIEIIFRWRSMFH